MWSMGPRAHELGKVILWAHGLNGCNSLVLRASQVALVVKNLPANAGDIRDMGLIPGLGREVMATHSSILAWIIPWTEGPGGLQSMGLQRVRHD